MYEKRAKSFEYKKTWIIKLIKVVTAYLVLHFLTHFLNVKFINFLMLLFSKTQPHTQYVYSSWEIRIVKIISHIDIVAEKWDHLDRLKHQFTNGIMLWVTSPTNLVWRMSKLPRCVWHTNVSICIQYCIWMTYIYVYLTMC